MTTTVIYWFRNDLRLLDNPALTHACNGATHLQPVYIHDPDGDAMTRWGFARTGAHRRHFLTTGLADLSQQLVGLGSNLLELSGRPIDVLPALARSLNASGVVCEAIAAPDEEAVVVALREAGLEVDTVWQSSMLDPAELPFEARRLPDVFTAFRQAVEHEKVQAAVPLPVPAFLPLPLPLSNGGMHNGQISDFSASKTPHVFAGTSDPRSSFPFGHGDFYGGSSAALAHLARYFERKQVDTYKATRNGLSGIDYSSKFSPWLASGAMSARTVDADLKKYEARHGANDGTYWLWFELMWRDYFRLLHLKYGRKLYAARGLAPPHLPLPLTTHKAGAFKRWCEGATGEPLVDAGMRELAATGYLSNRLRQVVASYLIHDLSCDWRAGAAWFESQLIDYDVYSNQGNWLYIAGRGTDPRGGRRFNPQKQARDYDSDGAYRALWN